jgi:hypothetical protein
MSAEKAEAFSESWSNMVAQSIRASQKLTLSPMRVWLGNMPVSLHSKQLQNAALHIVAKGMAPVPQARGRKCSAS